MPLQHQEHETGHNQRLQLRGYTHNNHNSRGVEAAGSVPVWISKQNGGERT
jgi:hypothetical protein